MVWFLLRPVYGVRLALAMLLLIGVATMLSFGLSGLAVGRLANDSLGLFQAFVSGTLLHVVVHRSYPIYEVGVSPTARRRQSGFGAIGGLVLLVFTVTDHFDPAIVDSSQAFTRLAWESAPAMFLAYLVAGLVYGLVPKGSLAWMSRGGNLSQSMRGVGFGLPLPICSCGVVPVYRSLVSKGVPVSAALSFLVATSQLSIDAVLMSVPLLGGEFTLVRVVCASAVALLVGWGVGLWVVTHFTPQHEVLYEEPPMRAQSRLVHSLKTGLIDVVDDTAPWIILGLGVAALADAFLLTNALNSIPDWSEVALFALLGIPTYVCASGATPLAAVLVYKDVSPGAALAFLLTGPATNLTTFGVLARLHGRRLAMAFASVIMVLSILLGWGVNVVSPVVAAPALKLESALQWGSWEGLCFLALCGLFLASFVRMGPRAFVSEIASDGEADHDHEYHHGEGRCV